MALIKDFFGNIMPVSGGTKGTLNASAASQFLTGSSGNDFFNFNGLDNVTAYGNGGDDSFHGVTSSDTIIVPANAGVTTVYANQNYTLQANINNLTVFNARGGGTGNAMANIITSTVRNVTLDGSGGNDVLISVKGTNYKFDAASGYDVITNFTPGARKSVGDNPDTVELAGYQQFTTFAQVKSAMTQVGADVVLQLDANDAIKILNTTISAFITDNFLLANAPSGLRMTFDDEFSGTLSAAGGNASAVWRTDFGWGANSNSIASRTLSGNGEKQLYVDSGMVSPVTGQVLGLNPFSITNGVLDIHAGPAPAADVAALGGYKFTSGMLSTRDSFTQTYGYFETKMQLPAGGGAWPAFWLYSANGNRAEIDIMESWSSDSWSATTHDYTTGSNVSGASNMYTPDLSTAPHTFGLLWTATTITWYLDGVAVRSIATPADMHTPMYMVVNLALSGSTPSTFSGADLSVDWVRAYSLDNAPVSVTSQSGNQVLTDAAGATVLTGSGCNDTFYVNNAATKAIETFNNGDAAVYSSVDFTLGANERNLFLSGSATHGTGNNLGDKIVGNNNGNILIGGTGNDTITGGTGNDSIKGRTGNDTLTGSGGHDTFTFASGFGQDTITDFNSSMDTIDLSAFSGQAFQLKGSGSSALLTIGSSSIRLSNETVSDLVAHGSIHATTMTAGSSGSYSGTF